MGNSVPIRLAGGAASNTDQYRKTNQGPMTLRLPYALAIRHNGLIDEFPTEDASPAQDRLARGGTLSILQGDGNH